MAKSNCVFRIVYINVWFTIFTWQGGVARNSYNLPGNLPGAAAPVGMDHPKSQADVQSAKKPINLFLKRSRPFLKAFIEVESVIR